MSATEFDLSREIGLNRPFKLKVDSPLKHYLEFLTKKEQSSYSLREIFTILKEVIDEGGHFDKTNPAIIVLDKNLDLEKALCVKACHVSEVRNLVMKQIEVYPTQSQGIGKSFESVGQVSCSGVAVADKYFVKQDFLRVLSPTDSCLKSVIKYFSASRRLPACSLVIFLIIERTYLINEISKLPL
jgi:hypothetical protein